MSELTPRIPPMLTAGALLADASPIPPDIVENALPSAQTILWSGEGGTGKSWMALDLCVHLSAGLDWLGLAVRQTGVLLIDLENEKCRLRERLANIARAHQLSTLELDQLPLHFAFALGSRLDSDQCVADTAGMVRICGAGLVCLDSLVDFYGPETDENNNPQMSMVAQRLRHITLECGASVLPIHHTSKASQSSPCGATSLRNGVAVSTMILRDGNTATLRTDKNRCGPCRTLTARPCWGEGTFDMQSLGSKDTPISMHDIGEQAILSVLADAKWQMSNDVVAKAMSDSGLGKTTLHSKMRNMIGVGTLEKDVQGYGKAYAVRVTPPIFAPNF